MIPDNHEKKKGGNNAENNEAYEKTLRLAHVPFMIGIPLALASYVGHTWSASEETSRQPYFSVALGMYAFSAVVELLTEPMHNLAQAQSRTNLRLRAEGLGVVLRTAVTFLVLLFDYQTGLNGRLALIGFSLGQLTYALVAVAIYASHYGFGKLWPDVSGLKSPKTSLDQGSLKVAKEMTWQSLIKLFLSEGDKVLLLWLVNLQDQGGYAVASNYGSLIARIVLMPLDEATRVFFAKAVSATPSSSDEPHSKEDPTIPVPHFFTNLLRTILTSSLLLLTLAPPYLPHVLSLLLPARYASTSAPSILHAWIFYIPFLALNGVLEAFYSAVADAKALARQSRYMILFSAVFIGSATLLFKLTNLGDASLIYANIVGMGARIIFCSAYADGWFKARQEKEENGGEVMRWRDVVPKTNVVLVIACARMLVRADEARVKLEDVGGGVSRGMLEHLGVGAGLGLVCVGVWSMVDGRAILQGRGRKVKGN